MKTFKIGIARKVEKTKQKVNCIYYIYCLLKPREAVLYSEFRTAKRRVSHDAEWLQSNTQTQWHSNTDVMWAQVYVCGVIECGSTNHNQGSELAI